MVKDVMRMNSNIKIYTEVLNMKNVLVLLMVFALIGSASAVYAPNTWGFAAPGAGNPYTFDGPDGSNLTNQTPDVWGPGAAMLRALEMLKSAAVNVP